MLGDLVRIRAPALRGAADRRAHPGAPGEIAAIEERLRQQQEAIPLQQETAQ